MTDEPTGECLGVVVAAGRSVRLGGDVPKQFLSLDGKWILRHSVDCLATRPGVGGVVVVLSPDEVDSDRGRTVGEWPGVAAVVAGGASRAESCERGVRHAARTAEFVLVHDAARPSASPAVVDAVLQATRRYGAAVPVIPVADTIKRVTDRGTVEATVDRTPLRRAQTPQGARASWLLAALADARAAGREITDEAAALEQAGHTVHVVDGHPDNRKITTPEDLEAARRARGETSMDLRIGTGFDIHRVDATRPLVLGGVRFDGEAGLAGHSDADVVLHAAMDAVLGAAAMGDIGVLFPPDDPRFAGADSFELTREVAGRVTDAGWEVVNLDLMLLAERPKIRPRAEQMRVRIAEGFGIEVDRVGLKATTLETLGALGRHEGIGCQAVALVRRR